MESKLHQFVDAAYFYDFSYLVSKAGTKQLKI